jgi:hypothetical protein
MSFVKIYRQIILIYHSIQVRGINKFASSLECAIVVTIVNWFCVEALKANLFIYSNKFGNC